MIRRIFSRRQAVLGTGAAIMTAAATRTSAADGDMASRLAEMERDGRVFGLHALLVSRSAKVLSSLWKRRGRGWGRKFGQSTFDPTVLHDLARSARASSACSWHRPADGKVPLPEARLYVRSRNIPTSPHERSRRHHCRAVLSLRWLE